MVKLSFKPKQVTKRLLSVLPERAREVIESRYGLGKEAESQTLEAIGQEYGITRERVRQIENYALTTIRRSNVFEEMEPIFNEIKKAIDDMGSIVTEEELLNAFAKDE